MKKISTSSDLKFTSDTVVKTNFEPAFTKEMFDLYSQLTAGKDYYVQIHEHVNEKKYIMERLDIKFNLNQILWDTRPYSKSWKTVNDIVIFTVNLTKDFFEFSSKNLPEGNFIIHHDLTFSNIVITSDDKIKLIDADGIRITTDPIEISLFFNRIQAIHHAVLWNYYDLRKYNDENKSRKSKSKGIAKRKC